MLSSCEAVKYVVKNTFFTTALSAVRQSVITRWNYERDNDAETILGIVSLLGNKEAGWFDEEDENEMVFPSKRRRSKLWSEGTD